MANANPDLGDTQVAVERLHVLGRGEEELVHPRGPAALRHGADLGLGVVDGALRVEEAHVVEGVEGLPPRLGLGVGLDVVERWWGWGWG